MHILHLLTQEKKSISFSFCETWQKEVTIISLDDHWYTGPPVGVFMTYMAIVTELLSNDLIFPIDWTYWDGIVFVHMNDHFNQFLLHLPQRINY